MTIRGNIVMNKLRPQMTVIVDYIAFNSAIPFDSLYTVYMYVDMSKRQHKSDY